MPIGWLLVERVDWKVCEVEQPKTEGTDRAGLPARGWGRGREFPRPLWAPALPAVTGFRSLRFPAGEEQGCHQGGAERPGEAGASPVIQYTQGPGTGNFPNHLWRQNAQLSPASAPAP